SQAPILLQCSFIEAGTGTSLVVQCVRLHAPNVGGPGFNPWLGT
ncbi:hypothetical protein DBR06_SOUSAS4410099, partial [Sousa chinensis]